MTDQPPAKPKRVYPRKTDRKRRPSPVPQGGAMAVARSLATKRGGRHVCRQGVLPGRLPAEGEGR